MKASRGRTRAVAAAASARCSSQSAQELLDQSDAILDGRCRALDPYAILAGKPVAAVLLDQRDQLAGIERRPRAEQDLRTVGPGIDLDHAERLRQQAQPMAIEQRLRLLGRQAEAIDQLLLHRRELGCG